MDEVSNRSDESLGLNTPITRRDFLNGAIISVGALWTVDLSPMELLRQHVQQPAAKVERESWGGNTQEVFDTGHAVRDGLFDDPNISAADTGEFFDLVVIGGGFSGLASAYYFNQAKAGRGMSQK